MVHQVVEIAGPFVRTSRPGRREIELAGTTVGAVESGIEDAYGREPNDRLHGCPACNVTWFGADERCWVCGAPADGPVVVVPANGSQTWLAARCVEAADAEETAAFLRRATTA